MKKVCLNCKKLKTHHAKGLCYSCYKKVYWKPKEAVCKRCKRKKIIHAKGLCASCYNSVYHSDKNKAYYQRKKNNIDIKTYKKFTKSCAVCGFDKIVNLHHIDLNKQNNSPENLVGLCPNHHRLALNQKYRKEVYDILLEKGIITKEYYEKLPFLSQNYIENLKK